MAEALIKAHRSSTSAQYEHCWRNFQSWLSSAPNAPISKGTILEYLVHLADAGGLNPKTVLVYRNALHLSLLHGFRINTKDQEFSLVARSQFIANPPRQKLIPHWRPNKVLSMLEQPRFVTSKASPINLMMKTLFLVALATGNRVSELAAMSRGSISFGEDRSRVTIPVKPGFLYKNQSMARAPPNITFPCLYNDDGSHHRLCPVSALHRWLQVSDPWGHDAVFINPQSKKPMNSGAISSYLVRTTNATAPRTFAKAHDVRKVAASLAWVRGVPPSKIIDFMFWHNTSVFINKYLVPIRERAKRCIAAGANVGYL